MMNHTAAPCVAQYVTISTAASALERKPWPVAQLIEQGELRAVRIGSQLFVSAYDVEQLGGVL